MSDDEGSREADPGADDAAEDAGASAVTTGEAGEDGEPPIGDDLTDRIAEHDEELAGEVELLVEKAVELKERLDDREERIEEHEEQIEDLKSRLKRKQADFENYKKRQDREKERIRERATEDLVERLLDVRDNLKRAADEDHDDVESVREGVKMTLKEFDRVLDAENVTEIDPEPGDEVDPQRHEVMMRVEDDAPSDEIVDVYAPGYEMAGKVLKAAQVTVGQGEAGGDDAGADDDQSDADGDATDEGADGTDDEDRDDAGEATDDAVASAAEEADADGATPAGDGGQAADDWTFAEDGDDEPIAAEPVDEDDDGDD